MDKLVLKIGGQEIGAPAGVPTGGLVIAGNKAISLAINVAFVFTILLTLVFVIWAGLDWIMSGGNKEGLQKARHKLLYAILGIGIVMLAFFIINFVGYSLGVQFFAP